MTTRNVGSGKGNGQRRLAVESLEKRTMLAGNVTASVVGGNLFIRGDNAANAVVVSEVGPGEFAVTGINDVQGVGTRIKSSSNGNGNGAVNNTLVFTGVTGNIDIDLKQGNDVLGVGNDESEFDALFDGCFPGVEGRGFGGGSEPETPSEIAAVAPGTLEVPRDLIINMGDGDDDVAVVAEARDGVILTGNQSDLVAVGGSFFRDDLVIDTGKGIDAVCVVDSEIVDLLSIATGNDSDLVEILGTEPEFFSTEIGTLVVTTGEGNDGVFIGGVAVNFAATINTGNGGSEVLLEDVFVGLGLSIVSANGADFVEVVESDLGALSIVTGNHFDDVRVEDVFVEGALTVVMGNGDDEVHLQFFDARSVVIDTGNGNDGTPDDDSPITVENADIVLDLVINTGSGNDLVLVQNIGCRTAVINSGEGHDHVDFFESETDLDLVITTLGGEDLVHVEGDGEENLVHIGRDLIINTGNQDDEVEIVDAVIHRNLTVSLGSGIDLFLADFIDVFGNATIDAGAGNDTDVAIIDSNIDGLLLVFMGAGNDFLFISGSFAGAAKLFGGSGSNSLDSDLSNAEVFQFEP